MKTNLTQGIKSTLLVLFFMLFGAGATFAQTPQFYNFNAGGSSNSFPLNNTNSNKVQWIYPPAVFNSMGTLGGTPAYLGLMTKVYFRSGSSSSPTFTDMSISLAQNVGTQANWTNGTYNLGMNTVFNTTPHSITALAGNWFEVTLSTPFLYDPALSLVVEMKQNGYTPTGITVRQDNGGGAARIWGGFASTVGSFGSGRADFGFDLLPPTPCNTIATVAGTLSPNNPTICSGQTINFTAPNSTLASGLAYQWQSSPNGVAWTNIAGATNLNYQTPPLVATTHYRLIITCTTNAISDTSSPSVVTVSPPTYASLPYSQDFEQWASYCDNSDVPNDYHWSNGPGTGNSSWRRQDQGPTAVWANPNLGLYFPSSSTGNFSARFHSFATTGSGNLDLYVDCSSSTGSKTLSFDYINDNSASGTDNLLIQYSTNGGSFFLPAAQYGSSISWQSIFVSIPSNAPNTIIRFTANGGSNSVPASDIGIDNVKVLSPCTGAPVAGTIDSVTACPNKPLILNISGGTLQGGVNYRWESSPNATGPWTFIGNSAGPTYSTTITTPTYWRCVMTCQATSQADTTAVRYVDVLPFYICYCDNAANTLFFENIGNVHLRNKPSNATVMNNGNPTPTLSNTTAINPYTLFLNLTPPILYRDSSYYLEVTGISNVNSFNNCWAKGYIDFNRDGVYNVTSELVFTGPVRSNTNYMALDSFTVPNITNYGLTGMRIILQEGGAANTVSPCNSFGRGEVEDYIVNLQLLPCNQPPNAGVSLIDDSTTCPNNTVRIVNNTHDRFFANLDFSWQESTDGVVFNDIPNGNVDTMFRVVNQNMWYRYRVTCQGTSTAYSNVTRVRILPPAHCIGVGVSTGPNDISDIGGIVISDIPPTNTNLYTFSIGGPHLNNPASYKYYTNYTAAGPLDLMVDTTYKFSVYHILNTAIHTDAQISIFIDFDGSMTFDPGERVYNGVATAANFFLTGFVNIPANALQGTPVIMRVVLNDDLGPNPASDVGLGTFVSGEVEDFYLRFNPKVAPLNVSETASIQSVGIYPNPTPGVVNINFKAQESTDVTVEVVSLTGSVIKKKELGRIRGNQEFQMDLTDLASGVYMMRFTANGDKFIRKITLSK